METEKLKKILESMVNLIFINMDFGESKDEQMKKAKIALKNAIKDL